MIFPLQECGLACFQVRQSDPRVCARGEKDCFGIDKVQRGFAGLVVEAGIEVQRMYPIVTVGRKGEE